MADLRSLVISGGKTKQVTNSDSLLVGAGIKTSAGNLTITPASFNTVVNGEDGSTLTIGRRNSGHPGDFGIDPAQLDLRNTDDVGAIIAATGENGYAVLNVASTDSSTYLSKWADGNGAFMDVAATDGVFTRINFGVIKPDANLSLFNTTDAGIHGSAYQNDPSITGDTNYTELKLIGGNSSDRQLIMFAQHTDNGYSIGVPGTFWDAGNVSTYWGSRQGGHDAMSIGTATTDSYGFKNSEVIIHKTGDVTIRNGLRVGTQKNGTAAQGTITTIDDTDIVDGEKITIDDGITPPVDFTFTSSANDPFTRVNATTYQVFIDGGSTAAQLADRLDQAIRNSASLSPGNTAPLLVTTSLDDNVITITNAYWDVETGIVGITDTVTDIDFTVTQDTDGGTLDVGTVVIDSGSGATAAFFNGENDFGTSGLTLTQGVSKTTHGVGFSWYHGDNTAAPGISMLPYAGNVNATFDIGAWRDGTNYAVHMQNLALTAWEMRMDHTEGSDGALRFTTNGGGGDLVVLGAEGAITLGKNGQALTAFGGIDLKATLGGYYWRVDYDPAAGGTFAQMGAAADSADVDVQVDGGALFAMGSATTLDGGNTLMIGTGGGIGNEEIRVHTANDVAIQSHLLIGTNYDGKQARGSVTTVAGANLIDGETIVVDDGVNPPVTFEFDDDNSVVETNTLRKVTFTSGSTANDVRDAIITAITNAPALDIDASSGGAGLVSLISVIVGVPTTTGNVAITTDVADGGFAVTGMSGAYTTMVRVLDSAGGVVELGERTLESFGTSQVVARGSAGISGVSAINDTLAYCEAYSTTGHMAWIESTGESADLVLMQQSTDNAAHDGFMFEAKTETTRKGYLTIKTQFGGAGASDHDFMRFNQDNSVSIFDTTILDAGTGKAYFPESPEWPGEKSFTIESSENVASWMQINQTNTNEKTVGFFAKNFNGTANGEVTLNLSADAAAQGTLSITPAGIAVSGKIQVQDDWTTLYSNSGSLWLTAEENPSAGSVDYLALEAVGVGDRQVRVINATLTTEGTGNIDLPNVNDARFKINGSSVGSTVTAANLDALTNGSVADALHTHTAVAVGTQTTTGLANGDFSYISSNDTWTKSQNNGTLRQATVIGAYEGVSGSVSLPGSIIEAAKFTTDGGSPQPGDAVFLAASTDDSGTGAGKLTATAPTTAGAYVTAVGVCLNNSNYAGSKTAKIVFSPALPILI
jgi:hypothetical protein